MSNNNNRKDIGWRAYEPNYIEKLSENNIVVSSGDVVRCNMVDPSPLNAWQSVGSDDITTETITIELTEPAQIDTIFLIGINWKDFVITYNNFQTLPNGSTIDLFDAPLLTGNIIDENDNELIDENGNNLVYATVEPERSGQVSNYARNTFWIKFPCIEISRIEISIDTTQTPDAEKILEYIILSKQIGNAQYTSSEAFPEVSFTNNEAVVRTINAKYSVQKKEETLDRIVAPITIADGEQGQYDFYNELVSRQEPFLIWLPAGLLECDFGIIPKGYRYRDVYKVQAIGSYNYSFIGDLYANGITTRITLREAV